MWFTTVKNSEDSYADGLQRLHANNELVISQNAYMLFDQGHGGHFQNSTPVATGGGGAGNTWR